MEIKEGPSRSIQKATVASYYLSVALNKATVVQNIANVASYYVSVALKKATVALNKANVASYYVTVALNKASVASNKATVALLIGPPLEGAIRNLY